jgi:hypothetical protein
MTKIYFGFENVRDLKVSSSVADKGLNLLKCKPFSYPIVGLRTIVQPGYDSYIRGLPSFMKATEIQKKFAITSLGNGTKLPMDRCLPIPLPPIFLMIRKTDRIDKVIGSDKKYIELFTRKEGTAYATMFHKDLIKIGTHASVLENVFPVDKHIKPNDTIVAVRVLQMLSSLLLTHKYPAFSDPDATSSRPDKGVDRESYTYKRTLEADDRLTKRKIVKVLETEFGSFHNYYKEDILDSTVLKIEFHSAKPTVSSTPAWGTTSEIPSTEGIHFPFDEDLAQPDGDTIPALIEQYLMPCLHDNPESCIKIFSDMVQSWKSSICRTTFGLSVTHLGRVLLVALPAQARVFPIIHDGVYLGSYMSGSHFSIGIKGVIIRPDSYDNNIKELDCYQTNDTIMQQIAELCSMNTESQAKVVKIGPNIRKLSTFIHKSYTLNIETREKLITLASTLRLQTPYKKCTPVNLMWAIDLLVKGVVPNQNEPMSPGAMFMNNDHFATVMSAFGSHVPSPEIPGASKWKVDSSSIPKKMVGVFAFRLCSLESARADWMKIRETDIIHNCPERISAIFEHTVVRGKEDREAIWSALYSWCQSYDDIRDREGAGLGKVVDAPEEGGIQIGDSIFDDFGF